MDLINNSHQTTLETVRPFPSCRTTGRCREREAHRHACTVHRGFFDKRILIGFHHIQTKRPLLSASPTAVTKQRRYTILQLHSLHIGTTLSTDCTIISAPAHSSHPSPHIMPKSKQHRYRCTSHSAMQREGKALQLSFGSASAGA